MLVKILLPIAFVLLIASIDAFPIHPMEEGSNNDGERNRRGCPKETMERIADLYLDAQVVSPNGWGEFITYLDDNVVSTTNVLREPVAVGKQAVIQILYGINTAYQRIYGVFKRPINYTAKNKLSAIFGKTQGSLQVKIPYNITFTHSFEFNNDCKVTRIDEFADFLKTLKSLSLETGDAAALTCNRIKHVCTGASYPDFGTTQNNCDLLWLNADRYTLEDSKFFDPLYLNPNGRTLLCANSIMSSIENTPQMDVATKTFLCSFFGKPLPNVPGCW